MDRREALTAGAALAALGTSVAAAAGGLRPNNPTGTLAPRGRFGRMERLAKLDLESRQEFLKSFRVWANGPLSRAAGARSEAILVAKGVAKDATPALGEVIGMIHGDPLLQISTRAWISCQQLSWNGLLEEFQGKSDKYLAEMEAVDREGPGRLELNPDLRLPDYTRHEIHIQPGGYVGNAFAGHLYHYGTNGFYQGRNDNDELHAGAAQRLPIPQDGKVRRILDVGCGVGQLTMALKERYPEAEVWGIDAGGPMVRYAHLRAVERGLDVNFAQRLGEDSKFPDGFFDLVTSYIMFHEVSPEGTHAVVNEAWRITRPGGVYYPIDFKLTNAPRRSAYGMYRLWWDHRWNNEVWSLKFRQTGLPNLIRAAGFVLNEDAPVALEGFGVLFGTKPG